MMGSAVRIRPLLPFIQFNRLRFEILRSNIQRATKSRSPEGDQTGHSLIEFIRPLLPFKEPPEVEVFLCKQGKG